MTFDESAFNKLRSDRLAYVDGLRRNKGFEAGILRLLTQLYPDNAHFIYELLQNAEDAKALHARFKLTNECLIFEHDGFRLFSLRDVESITSIGDSTKADSPTEIGKFGVGFKAVFAYTQTPEVHSGDYHFLISDLVVPEKLSSTKIDLDSFKTKFIFPFNHATKSAKIAVAEITKALEELNDATLLFLSNIKVISYKLPDNSNGSLEKSINKEKQFTESNGELIEVKVSKRDSIPSQSYWLRYIKKVSVNEEFVSKEFSVAIAFAMQHTDSKAKVSGWEIVPLNPGRVSIYFPAEKELSNLRFHIHAPFASTVARDSVRDTEGNKLLLDAISELIVQSMDDIRVRGLLTASFLAVLPIEEDAIPKFYQPVMDRLIEVFKNSALVPARYAGYRAGNELFRGPSDLINLINDKDLELLTRDKWNNVAWCANIPSVNQRANKFLDSLDIDEWSWREFFQSINCEPYMLRAENNFDRPERLCTWLSGKEDYWLRKFYIVLNDATEKYFSNIKIGNLPCVRVENQGVYSMVRPSKAYFPLNSENLLPEDILLVKPTTYLPEKITTQINGAIIFLEKIGVRVFDEAADLERLVSTYDANNYPNLKQHRVHMKRFIQFFKSNPERIDIFKRKPIFVSSEIDEIDEAKLDWGPASNFYLDFPFMDTGLSGTFTTKGKKSLWLGYEKITEKIAFVNFVKALGIKYELSIIKAEVWSNPNKDKLCQDWYIAGVRESPSCTKDDWILENIAGLISNQKIENSRIIWVTLVNADGLVAKARYKPNLKYEIREADSQLVHYLKNHAWIPGKDGKFHFPKDISRDQLLTGFTFDDRNGLLTAIGFEANIQRQTKEYELKDIAAKNFGFDGVDAANEMANILKVTGLGSQEAAQIIKNFVKPDQPEGAVVNPLRRMRGIQEHRENAPTKEAVLRERAIQPNVQNVVAEAKAYLRAKYTNPLGQMVCQICRSEMPFKLKTGEYYFEAVQVIRGLSNHFYENRLALCPTCAAMYQFARKTSDDELKKIIKVFGIENMGSSVELDLMLAGSLKKLRFVGVHFFDLKVVLDKTELTNN
jgi:hypothetical protein